MIENNNNPFPFLVRPNAKGDDWPQEKVMYRHY